MTKAKGDDKGKGGQPPKLVLRTKGGWVADKLVEERAFNEEVANFTRKTLQSVEAPKEVFAQAFAIIRGYRQQLMIHDNPRASRDKNGKGVGRFGNDLKRRSAKMAEHLDTALKSEMSHDLANLIGDYDLRSHMEVAYHSLTCIEELINRASEGDKPEMSQAEIRIEAGGKLKALARKHSLPLMDFVKAFNIHDASSTEAFEQWFQSLNG